MGYHLERSTALYLPILLSSAAAAAAEDDDDAGSIQRNGFTRLILFPRIVWGLAPTYALHRKMKVLKDEKTAEGTCTIVSATDNPQMNS
ncbi:hypothetical protein V6N13_087509 [Hibiscus sabdariffa]|uniref:Secreted protein n=1 Tax=Hibiscus sabdariffa TaxID=183260 RepID=A0ABR2FXA2_9ROSI